jgi:hypothetical protein
MTMLRKLLLLTGVIALGAEFVVLVAMPLVISNMRSVAPPAPTAGDFDRKAFDEQMDAFGEFNKIADEWLDAFRRRDLAAMQNATRRQTAILCSAPLLKADGWHDANCGAAP